MNDKHPLRTSAIYFGSIAVDLFNRSWIWAKRNQRAWLPALSMSWGFRMPLVRGWTRKLLNKYEEASWIAPNACWATPCCTVWWT